ncbi:hypothetical protein [Yinghuangia sp. YIM S09857]|uniref:hypothetical protein n=1 Tax=Yinghuangia sp. YIM S09857 TaxID=3436929 RepID=UPI003F538B88
MTARQPDPVPDTTPVPAPEPGVIPALFAGFVDDAAIFPPGNLPLAEAVEAHHAHRASWYADLVGQFLVGSGRIADLAALADPERPLRVGVVVAGGAAAVGDAVRMVLETPGLVLAGVEANGDPAELVGAFHEHLPEGVPGAIEVVADQAMPEALDAIAETRHRAKFRTGGTVAEAFPEDGRLAAFLAECVARELPFKLTAGLHNAVRHTDPVTGFRHHGFLNVLTALRVAQADRAEGLPLVVHSIARPLGESDPAPVAARVRLTAAAHGAEYRAAFTAFGSCSVAEPLADLISLGLIAPPSDPKEQTP